MSARRQAEIHKIDFRPAQNNRFSAVASSRTISFPLVTESIRVFDAIGILAIGWLTAPSNLERPFASPYATVLFALLGAIAMATVAHLVGVYRQDMHQSLISSTTTALTSLAVTMGIVGPLAWASALSGPAVREWLEFWMLGAALLLALSRYATRISLRKWRASGRLRRDVVVLGAGPVGQKLILKLGAAAQSGVRIVGVYDDRATRVPRFCLGHPVLGTVDDLLRDARSAKFDCVLVALPMSADWRLVEIMNKLCLIPADVRLCLDNIGLQVGTCGVTHLNGLTMLNVCERPLKGWNHAAKIVEDRVLGAIILALVAPVMAIAAVLVKLDSCGPILFRQKRYGLNNELIEVLKFRTLYDEARDPNAERLCGRDDPRVTRVGAFLRRTMIDELPQFINVMRGEMSIVGPRPHAMAAKAGGLLYREVVKYYDARHRMKPGITGWAQINGWRGETRTVEEIDQRVAHDLYYIQNWSILFDLRIILWTVLGAFLSLLPRKRKNPANDAVPLDNSGRSRSAA